MCPGPGQLPHGRAVAVVCAIAAAATIVAALVLTTGRQADASSGATVRDHGYEAIDPGREHWWRLAFDDGRLSVITMLVPQGSSASRGRAIGHQVDTSGGGVQLAWRPIQPGGKPNDDDGSRQVALVSVDRGTEQVLTRGQARATIDSLASVPLIVASSIAVLVAGAWWLLPRHPSRPARPPMSPDGARAETTGRGIPAAHAGYRDVGSPAHHLDPRLRALELSREQHRRLVLDAAHELRTPMTSISANIDWLSRAPDVDAGTRGEVLVSVRHELRELESVMGEIIDLAIDRHEDPPFERIDLAAIAGTAVERFRRRSDRPVRVRSRQTIVVGDADALRRVVANLLANADAYSTPHAPITIDVCDGGVWVSDQGAGIPEAERARVFDRHYRRPVHRDKPGSGLGLSIAASTVRAHKGTIDIGDADGGGARVGFRLPLATDASSPIGP